MDKEINQPSNSQSIRIFFKAVYTTVIQTMMYG